MSRTPRSKVGGHTQVGELLSSRLEVRLFEINVIVIRYTDETIQDIRQLIGDAHIRRSILWSIRSIWQVISYDDHDTPGEVAHLLHELDHRHFDQPWALFCHVKRLYDGSRDIYEVLEGVLLIHVPNHHRPISLYQDPGGHLSPAAYSAHSAQSPPYRRCVR